VGDLIKLHRGTYDPQFPRYVRPIPHEHKARAMGDPDAVFARQPVDLDEWLNRGRKERLQYRIALAALAVAWFAVIYFAFQLGRGAF
jgi:hypothetical protein